jgi:hypothetical protein
MARIVCDPQAGVEKYEIVGFPTGPIEVAAQPDGSLMLDIGTVAPGDYNLSIYAEEGVFKSDPAPFGFTRPNLASPFGLRLIA